MGQLIVMGRAGHGILRVGGQKLGSSRLQREPQSYAKGDSVGKAFLESRGENPSLIGLLLMSFAVSWPALLTSGVPNWGLACINYFK